MAKPVVALPPPPPVAEPPVLDTCAKLQPPSPPLSRAREAPPETAAATRARAARRVARRGRAARRALGEAPRGVGHLPPRAAPVVEDAAPVNIETQAHSAPYRGTAGSRRRGPALPRTRRRSRRLKCFRRCGASRSRPVPHPRRNRVDGVASMAWRWRWRVPSHAIAATFLRCRRRLEPVRPLRDSSTGGRVLPDGRFT